MMSGNAPQIPAEAPPLRYGKPPSLWMVVDEAEHFPAQSACQRRFAPTAVRLHRNTVRLPAGIAVYLHRNPHRINAKFAEPNGNAVLMHFPMEALVGIGERLSDRFESLSIGQCGGVLDPHLSTINWSQHSRGVLGENSSFPAIRTYTGELWAATGGSPDRSDDFNH